MSWSSSQLLRSLSSISPLPTPGLQRWQVTENRCCSAGPLQLLHNLFSLMALLRLVKRTSP